MLNVFLVKRGGGVGLFCCCCCYRCCCWWWCRRRCFVHLAMIWILFRVKVHRHLCTHIHTYPLLCCVVCMRVCLFNMNTSFTLVICHVYNDELKRNFFFFYEIFVFPSDCFFLLFSCFSFLAEILKVRRDNYCCTLEWVAAIRCVNPHKQFQSPKTLNM